MKKLILGLLSLCVMFVVLGRPAYASSSVDYAKTKYPIVLVHGLLGWGKMFGVWDYFNGIPTGLTADGATVYLAQLSQANSDAVRGEQLLAQVQQVLATTGATKVNLIGHSMGGLDARYVAAVRPDLVASVTTIGTPHLGSAAAAGATTGLDPAIQALIAGPLNGLGQLMAFLSGSTQNPQDAFAAMISLSPAGAAAFNAKYPAGVPISCTGNGDLSANGVNFYSWGGVGVLTNLLDPTDILFLASSLAFSGSDHDGLVSRCSSHFGLIIKDNYIMNHLDEINQILGLIGWFTPSPVMLFQQHANRLKLAGL